MEVKMYGDHMWIDWTVRFDLMDASGVGHGRKDLMEIVHNGCEVFET